MKAVRLHAYGAPEGLVYEDVPDPVPGPGQVVIDVLASSVNPYEYKLRAGWLKEWYPFHLPAFIGGDVAGVVSAVGEGVSGYKVGDRVFGMVPIAAEFGAYAEKTLAPLGELTHLPAGLAPEQAVALGVGGTTGWKAVHDTVKPKPGDRVLVTGGLGVSGRAAAHFAAKAGAVVFAGVRGRQIDEAKAVGTPVAIDDEAALATVGPFDAIIETTGNMNLAAAAMKHLKPGAIFAAVAGAPPTEGVNVQNVAGRGDGELLDLMANEMLHGGLTIPIGRVMKIADAAEAHRLAEAGGAGKIVLVP